jgi:hypothetical protein
VVYLKVNKRQSRQYGAIYHTLASDTPA